MKKCWDVCLFCLFCVVWAGACAPEASQNHDDSNVNMHAEDVSGDLDHDGGESISMPPAPLEDPSEPEIRILWEGEGENYRARLETLPGDEEPAGLEVQELKKDALPDWLRDTPDGAFPTRVAWKFETDEQLRDPLRMRIGLSRDLSEDEFASSSLYFINEETRTLEPARVLARDNTSRTLDVALTHFSLYALVNAAQAFGGQRRVPSGISLISYPVRGADMRVSLFEPGEGVEYECSYSFVDKLSDVPTSSTPFLCEAGVIPISDMDAGVVIVQIKLGSHVLVAERRLPIVEPDEEAIHQQLERFAQRYAPTLRFPSNAGVPQSFSRGLHCVDEPSPPESSIERVDRMYRPVSFEELIPSNLRARVVTLDSHVVQSSDVLDGRQAVLEYIAKAGTTTSTLKIENTDALRDAYQWPTAPGQPAHVPTVYWRAQMHDEDTALITYWMFYTWDPKVPGINNRVAKHPFDRESMTVILDRVGTTWRPTGVAYGAHAPRKTMTWVNTPDSNGALVPPPHGEVEWEGDGYFVPWSEVSRAQCSDDSPEAFIALGSHAIFQRAGNYGFQLVLEWQEPACGDGDVFAPTDYDLERFPLLTNLSSSDIELGPILFAGHFVDGPVRSNSTFPPNIDRFAHAGKWAIDSISKTLVSSFGSCGMASCTPDVCCEGICSEPNPSTITTGTRHTCALADNGDVWCWGANDAGQLGARMSMWRSSPVLVMSGVEQVEAGRSRTCASKADGTLWCWGANDFGQLGVGVIGEPSTPVQVMQNVAQFSVGLGHTCAVNQASELYCWGFNGDGRLGDGTTTDRLTPTRIRADVYSVSVGSYHTCLVTSEGSVECWGNNSVGQIGDGTTTNRSTPTPVAGLRDIVEVSAGGSSSCAVSGSGVMSCWGQNVGQIPDAEFQSIHTSPGYVWEGVRHVHLGWDDGCVISDTGDLHCWGVAQNGEVGTGIAGPVYNSLEDTPMIEDVVLSEVVAVSMSTNGHACARRRSDELSCWGSDLYGQLGSLKDIDRWSPALVGGGYTDVDSGGYHTCAIRSGGALDCWGMFFEEHDDQLQPLVLPSPTTIINSGVIKVSSGEAHTCAIAEDGKLSCWGLNVSGELGVGEPTSEVLSQPVEVLANVVDVAAGGQHTCAIDTSSALWCWGSNAAGQVGDGTGQSQNRPVEVGVGFVGVSTGGGTTCAITTTGNLKCWGNNFNGQVGDASNTSRGRPVDVLAGVRQVSLGQGHTCAVTSLDELYCWGTNASGQLGPGITDLSLSSPRHILDGVASVTVGSAHTCALMQDGELRCFGANNVGQVGNGAISFTESQSSILSGFSQASAGVSHTCALRANGEVLCWGNDNFGAIGRGEPLGVFEPGVSVPLP